MQAKAASSGQKDEDFFGRPRLSSIPQEEASRDHAVASYGQLLSGGSTWNSGFGRSELDSSDPLGTDLSLADPAAASSSADASSSSRPRPAQSSMQISVADPVQREEVGLLPGVMGKYTSYGIRTKTNRPGFRQQDISVRRRFRDFVVCPLPRHA